MINKILMPSVLLSIGLAVLVPSQQSLAKIFQENTPAQQENKQQQKKKQADAEASETAKFVVPGIAVGESLPEINLKNQNGSEVAIKEISRKGPVALIFYRSASW